MISLVLRFHVKVLLILMTFFILTSCSSPSKNDSEDCSMAIDTVKIIDEKSIENTTYYLVLRISGWHDKSEIVEIYNVRPQFNSCSISDVEPIVSDSLELDSTVTHLYFDVKTKSLDIEYKDGEPDKFHNKNLKIEIKNVNGESVISGIQGIVFKSLGKNKLSHLACLVTHLLSCALR